MAQQSWEIHMQTAWRQTQTSRRAMGCCGRRPAFGPNMALPESDAALPVGAWHVACYPTACTATPVGPVNIPFVIKRVHGSAICSRLGLSWCCGGWRASDDVEALPPRLFTGISQTAYCILYSGPSWQEWLSTGMLNRTPARMGGPSAADPPAGFTACGLTLRRELHVYLVSCILDSVSHSRSWPGVSVYYVSRGGGVASPTP